MSSREDNDSMPPQRPDTTERASEESSESPFLTPLTVRKRQDTSDGPPNLPENGDDVFSPAFDDNSINDYREDKPADASPLVHRLSQALIPAPSFSPPNTPTKTSTKPPAKTLNLHLKQPLAQMNKSQPASSKDPNQHKNPIFSTSVLGHFNTHPTCANDNPGKEKEKDRIPSDTFSDCNIPESDIGQSRHTSDEYKIAANAVNLKNKHSPLRKAMSESLHPDSEKALGMLGFREVEKSPKKERKD